MKKAPFFLYERDKGLVSKEYHLEDFFNKGFLNKGLQKKTLHISKKHNKCFIKYLFIRREFL